MAMNLFDGFQKYSDINISRATASRINYQLAELESRLVTDLKNAFLDLSVALKNHQVAKNSLTEAKENLRINEFSFSKGVATATDMLDAIFYLSQAKFNEINANSSIFSNYYRLIRMVEEMGDT